MTGGYSQQGYRPRPPTSWGPPGQPPMQQPGYGYMQPGAYPGAPPQYNMSQPPYGGYAPPPASGAYSSAWDQSSNQQVQQTTAGTGYDYYNQQQQQPQQQQQQQPPAGGSAPADNTGYNYGQPPSYSSQGSYGEVTYSQASTGQQQGYGQDNYSGGYHVPAAQPGYSQPASNPQGGYDHQQGYGSTPAYGAVVNPTQDGSTTTYGVQGGSTQAPPVQPSPVQQGYVGQQPSTTPTSYPSQVTGQMGYGISPTSQPGYGNQPPAQTGYPQSVPSTQSSYGQTPQGPKPPASQAVYGQAQQSPISQVAPMQPGYQTGYGQQQSYGGMPPPSQPGYGQQQQQYGDSYGSGGYSQPPVYSSESSVHGSYEAPAPAQVGPTAVSKASPQG